MTISEVGLDGSDFSLSTERENNFFDNNNITLSGRIIIHLNSLLSSPKYQLRRIEDKGSISDSLTAAKIDIFDRTPLEEHLLMRALKSVTLFAASFFALPIFTVIGIGYHGIMASKHLIVWLVTKNEETAYNWKKFNQHKYNFMCESGHTIFCLITGIAGGIGFLLMVDALAVLSAFKTSWLGHLFLNGNTQYSPTEEECYCFYKSMELRKEFGIANAKNDEPLNWNWDKDRDVFTGLYYFRLAGYLGDLLKKQGIEFLDLIKEFQKQLPQDSSFKLTYPPKAKQVVDFLESHPIFSDTKTEELKEKFCRLETNIKLTTDLISGGFSLSQTDQNPRQILFFSAFPLSEAECRAYFLKPE